MHKSQFFGGTRVGRRKKHGLVMVRRKKRNKGDGSSSSRAEKEEVLSESATSGIREEETASTALDTEVPEEIPEQVPAFRAPKSERPMKDKNKGTSADAEQEEQPVPVPQEFQRPGPSPGISGFREQVEHPVIFENPPPMNPLPDDPQSFDIVFSTLLRDRVRNTPSTASGRIEGFWN